MNKFYLTTPIYYVNDVPHIGHAYTTLAADVLARYWRSKIGGKNVFFLTGTDEHGQKVAQAAAQENLSPKQYADKVSPRFKEAWKLLNIEPDYFIRTTDPRHEKVVLELLEKIHAAHYIYPGTYKGLYCVGCEKFLTETELVDGKCPLHPNKEPVYQEEKNYFFKLSGKLADEVKEKIIKGDIKILPKKREHEVLSRLELGADDISISREGVSWGIPLPWDKDQTTYVWVDALINYYSATRFLENKTDFWPADIHLIGKDILWFHAVIWPALLIAAGIEPPKTVFAHGFFTINGQKMSKSLGNTISPKQLVERYGVDGARYLIISAYPFGEDGDISLERFDKKYNADLANGLGNLVSRVAKLVETNSFTANTSMYWKWEKGVDKTLEAYELNEALKIIWDKITATNQYLNAKEPWKLKGKELEGVLTQLVDDICQIAYNLKPFLPETAEKIEKQFSQAKIVAGEPLFPRLK